VWIFFLGVLLVATSLTVREYHVPPACSMTHMVQLPAVHASQVPTILEVSQHSRAPSVRQGRSILQMDHQHAVLVLLEASVALDRQRALSAPLEVTANLEHLHALHVHLEATAVSGKRLARLVPLDTIVRLQEVPPARRVMLEATILLSEVPPHQPVPLVIEGFCARKKGFLNKCCALPEITALAANKYSHVQQAHTRPQQVLHIKLMPRWLSC
jgi:hypothetical protein